MLREQSAGNILTTHRSASLHHSESGGSIEEASIHLSAEKKAGGTSTPESNSTGLARELA